MKKKFIRCSLLLVVTIFFLLPTLAFCAEYTCEVMSIKGSVHSVSDTGEKKIVKEGDLLKAGTTIEVDQDSYMDLAYDKQWNNVSRIGEDSKITIRSIYPTDVYMDKGDILAKLHKLPAKSTFEVETPTAIAAVRGSEYRTVCRDGQTDVFNLHTSNVEVYGKDPDGSMMREAVILKQDEKTAINHLGDAPNTPEKMPEKEKEQNHALSDGLKKEVESQINAGVTGKTQDIEQVEKDYAVQMQTRVEKLTTEPDSSKENKSDAGKDTKAAEKDASLTTAPDAPDKGSAGDNDGPRESNLEDRINKTTAATDTTAGIENRLEKTADNIDKTSDSIDRKVEAITNSVDKKTDTVTSQDQNKKSPDTTNTTNNSTNPYTTGR